jgi:hypothetical protein
MWWNGRGTGDGGADTGTGVDARRPSALPEAPDLAQMRAYWIALRKDLGRLPMRSEIDPRGFETALESAFVAERLAPGVARFRLAGMRLNDLMGMEVRGMPLTVFFEPADRDETQRRIERAFCGPAVVELRLASAARFGQPALSGRMLLLPLMAETEGQGTRLLGGLSVQGAIGRAPRRFRVTGCSAIGCGRSGASGVAAGHATAPATGPGNAPQSRPLPPAQAPAAPEASPAFRRAPRPHGVAGRPPAAAVPPERPAPRERPALRLVYSAD